MVILEGRSIEDTVRATSHSSEAVTRYVQDYRRVCACLSMGLNVEHISFNTPQLKKALKRVSGYFQGRSLAKV
jgi:hypothetical protein